MGRTVQVVAVDPRDEFRYGYRLWIDEKTAMPLKTELCDGDGKVIEQIVFASLSLPERIPDLAFSRNSPPMAGAGCAKDRGARPLRWVRRVRACRRPGGRCACRLGSA